MTDWASDAAAKFVQRESTNRQTEARAAQKQQMLETQGLPTWDRLRSALQAQVKDFNDRVGREVLVAPLTKNDTLTIFAKLDPGQRELTAHFKESEKVVNWNARDTNRQPDKVGSFPMMVNQQNRVVFSDSGVSHEQSDEKVVSTMLNALLQLG